MDGEVTALGMGLQSSCSTSMFLWWSDGMTKSIVRGCSIPRAEQMQRACFKFVVLSSHRRRRFPYLPQCFSCWRQTAVLSRSSINTMSFPFQGTHCGRQSCRQALYTNVYLAVPPDTLQEEQLPRLELNFLTKAVHGVRSLRPTPAQAKLGSLKNVT